MFGIVVLVIFGVVFNFLTLANAAIVPNPVASLLFWIGGNQLFIALITAGLVARRIDINTKAQDIAKAMADFAANKASKHDAA